LQAKKDAERWVAEAEAMGQEDKLQDKDITQAQEPKSEPMSDWCYMCQVLSLQEDFATEKPMLQHQIKSHGNICMFLPMFHREPNPIKMLWGYTKYPECLIFSHFLFHLSILEVITTYLKVNFPPQKNSYLNVLIWMGNPA